MVYKLVIGDQVIHIKSDMILDKSDSEDDEHDEHESSDGEGDESKDGEDDQSNHDRSEESNEESNDDEDDESDDDVGGWGGWRDDEEVEELPAELLEVSNDGRGPLYHNTCNNELLHPKDARIYRIRSVEAKGSRGSRVQSDMVIKDFRHVKWVPRLSDPNLEYETIGSPGEEDKPPVQVKLAFLRVNKQVYEEASTILYSTRTFGFDDATTFAQFFSIRYNPIAKPPTSTNGTNLTASKRNSIRSVHIRAQTALSIGQKIKWMAALDAATFVLPSLEKIRVLFDLSHEKTGRYVDRTFWQYWRHQNGFPLLKTAEVSVATHLVSFWIRNDAKDEPLYEFRDVSWRVDFLEAVVGYHMDVLFGASLLDEASVARREAVFAEDWAWGS